MIDVGLIHAAAVDRRCCGGGAEFRGGEIFEGSAKGPEPGADTRQKDNTVVTGWGGTPAGANRG
jgi:hypothetical protein